MSDLNFDGWSCPLPLRDYPNVVLGHGGGGKLSAELVQHLFMPAFQNETLQTLSDSAVLALGGQRLAFSTDLFVVRPLFFPGGCIGDLAVNGTINDLAMSGARPLFLSAGFIIEEGMPLNLLGSIAERMGEAARHAGVTIVTGDTKVVERGHGDGVYINTSGIGIVPDDLHIAPQRAQPGDVVLVSGTLGDHGMAVMSAREGLEFDAEIEFDCAPLHDLVAAMLAVTPEILRAARPDTRRRGILAERDRRGGESRHRDRRGEHPGSASGAVRLRDAGHGRALRRQRRQADRAGAPALR